MNIGPHTIGVCSWSLRIADIRALAEMCTDLGLSHVQLALGNLLSMDEAARKTQLQALQDSKLQLTAGMIGFPGEDYSTIATIRQTGGVLPDDLWPQRREVASRAIELAAQLGLTLLSTHVGFIPRSDDPRYPTVLQRVDDIARQCQDHGITLLMETGQER